MNDFPHAFLIVFRIQCGEWIQSMWSCMHSVKEAGSPGLIPVCLFIFVGSVLVGNLIVSVTSFSGCCLYLALMFACIMYLTSVCLLGDCAKHDFCGLFWHENNCSIIVSRICNSDPAEAFVFKTYLRNSKLGLKFQPWVPNLFQSWHPFHINKATLAAPRLKKA